jgi:hypothetical protein
MTFIKNHKFWVFMDLDIHTVVFCNVVSNLSEEHTEFFRFEDALVYTYETTRRHELEYK